jgi:hypothetical protein
VACHQSLERSSIVSGAEAFEELAIGVACKSPIREQAFDLPQRAAKRFDVRRPDRSELFALPSLEDLSDAPAATFFCEQCDWT